MAKYDHLKETLYKFYNNNRNLSRKEIFDKFHDLGAPKRTLNRWLASLEQNKTLARENGSGRVAKKVTRTVKQQIKKKFNHRSGCSQRKVAQKFNISKSYVQKILKQSSNIRCYKKIKIPDMTDKQKKLARPKCRKLLKNYRGSVFILDDESYFTLSNTTLSGNDRFYSNNVQKTPERVKYKYKSKYEQKIMVWIAISPSGMSKPLFLKSGLAVNQLVYRKQCLEDRLLPFINKYHSDGNNVFWPDLSTSHYANTVQKYLKDKNVQFVPKNINPANVPKVRPIEDFWGLLKAKVYEKNWSAKNINQLQKKIQSCLSKMDLNLVQRTASSVHQRLDTVQRHGLDAL